MTKVLPIGTALQENIRNACQKYILELKIIFIFHFCTEFYWKLHFRNFLNSGNLAIVENLWLTKLSTIKRVDCTYNF